MFCIYKFFYVYSEMNNVKNYLLTKLNCIKISWSWKKIVLAWYLLFILLKIGFGIRFGMLESGCVSLKNEVNIGKYHDFKSGRNFALSEFWEISKTSKQLSLLVRSKERPQSILIVLNFREDSWEVMS